MSRKMLKSMARDGQRRRSPRISALDECKENHQNRQLSTTRTMIKRKFNDSPVAPVSKFAKQVWKGRESPQYADQSTDIGEWRSIRESEMITEHQKHDDRAITNGKPSIMPAKHILELVLDTLQRRDTYEIFAEPVDPDEVEDYYEIIKEPMDFGTMRAKLHEGMYENLEQFEHDVFLIPENAMHFNSSATIYFRQARAIHELAKKVFHALKTDPENFVSEFSGTRRRSMRKALSDTKDSRFPIPQCPSTSTFRRTNKKNPVMTDHFRARNFMNGSRDVRLSDFDVADRRLTYLYSNKDCADSTFYSTSTCKPLVPMNQGDISYKDSLMSFLKDLGPTAQMVAKRKLLGQHESNESQIGPEKSQNSAATQMKAVGLDAKQFRTSAQCQNSAAPQMKPVGLDAKQFRTFRDFAPAGCNPFLKASKLIIDLTRDGEEANCSNRGKEKTDTDNGNAPGKEKIDMPNPVRRDLNCSTSRINDATSFKKGKARPVILALENYHCNVAEYKPRIKRNCTVPTPLTKTRPAACDEAPKQQPLPIISKFAFDLPFLKARLNQMKAVDIGRKSRCSTRGHHLRTRASSSQ